MATVVINIRCGERTCARTAGEFCQYFGSIRFGMVPVCRLFPSDDNSYTELEAVDGWTLRCKDCLTLTKGS